MTTLFGCKPCCRRFQINGLLFFIRLTPGLSAIGPSARPIIELGPSADDAAFLVVVVDRLRELAADPNSCPSVEGVEIHGHGARIARQQVREAGTTGKTRNSDFLRLNL